VHYRGGRDISGFSEGQEGRHSKKRRGGSSKTGKRKEKGVFEVLVAKSTEDLEPEKKFREEANDRMLKMGGKRKLLTKR